MSKTCRWRHWCHFESRNTWAINLSSIVSSMKEKKDLSKAVWKLYFQVMYYIKGWKEVLGKKLGSEVIIKSIFSEICSVELNIIVTLLHSTVQAMGMEVKPLRWKLTEMVNNVKYISIFFSSDRKFKSSNTLKFYILNELWIIF